MEKIFFHLTTADRGKLDEDNSSNTSLKQATFVCKRWNEVISTSTKLMSKFILQLAEISINVLEYPLVIRKYQKCVLFKIDKESAEKCLNIVRMYGPTLREITLHGTYPEDIMNIFPVLSHCPNIRTLRFYNVFSDSKFKSIKMNLEEDFPELKTLSVLNRPQDVSLFVF